MTAEANAIIGVINGATNIAPITTAALSFIRPRACDSRGEHHECRVPIQVRDATVVLEVQILENGSPLFAVKVTTEKPDVAAGNQAGRRCR